MLVDDHEIVIEGIKHMLNAEPTFKVINSAGSVRELFETLNACKPDLVLLDLKLTDGDGISAAVKLKKQCPDIKVLILSAFIEPDLAQEAKRIGIDGYILKTLKPRKLISAIKKVLKDEKVYDSEVETLTDKTLSDPLKHLSNRERQLIRLIALGKTSKEIAIYMDLTEKTIRNYTTGLYQKINVSSRSEAVAYYMRDTLLNRK